jgi:hypothetical protein
MALLFLIREIFFFSFFFLNKGDSSITKYIYIYIYIYIITEYVVAEAMGVFIFFLFIFILFYKEMLYKWSM